MVEIEIDGVKVEVPEGSMVMHAAQKLGKYIPHFCYHPKLSIAANCRMCLVEVEKAPKPLPACATPVSPGMVVRTASDKAVDAQKSVMEFLLINHPLDCPICDQGGECQLQDIAVGYGGVQSRYAEEKRVVFHKEIGPLVSAQEMSRCIHCTRCVRFGQEVAGTMELGMANRGEHSEILSFVGQSVDSELSGNMIDLCPVGALTSKPFRYSARTWELSRRRSIAAHDSLGSNITVQVKADKVLRVVPLENESINECWLSDRDRFSYEGLNAADRLTEPMIKKNGQWAVTDWQTVLNVVVEGLKKAKREATSGNDLVVLCSPNAPYEEMALMHALLKGLDTGIATANLRQHDAAALLNAHPWLGGSILELAAAEAVIAVGLDPRNDQPLLTQRLRQSAKAGAAVVLVNAGGQDPLIPKATWLKTPASQWADTLGHDAIKTALSMPGGKFVLLGPQVLMSPHAAEIIAKAQALCQAHQATLGFLGDGANWVGAYVSGLQRTNKTTPSAATLLANAPKAVVVWGAEPQLDALQGAKVLEGLQKASFVVQACAYLGEAKQYADVILPIAPFTETSGTFINIEGTVQSFKASVKPLGNTRPGWKVLRVLGNLLELPGFDFNSSEEVLRAHLPSSLPLNNDVKVVAVSQHTDKSHSEAEHTLELASFVPIYHVDAVVRRAPSLQQTKAARPGLIQISQATANQLGLVLGDMAVLSDALGGTLKARVYISKHIADGVAYVPIGRTETLSLKASSGAVSVQVVKLVGEVSA